MQHGIARPELPPFPHGDRSAIGTVDTRRNTTGSADVRASPGLCRRTLVATGITQDAADCPPNSPSEPRVGRTYTENMRTRSFARLTALLAVASIVAGCSAANGDGGSSTSPLQLRLVTSSAEGPCSAPPLTSDGPGSACDRAGTTTYELGESLGVVTPTSVARGDQRSGQTVVVGFDTADSNKLGDVTRRALEKRLAILLEGRVLAAPVVKDPITTGNVSFAFGTASEAGQVVAALGTSPTS